MAEYTQAQIDEVMRQVNAGEVTVDELSSIYGVPAAEIQANIDQINGMQVVELNADPFPSSLPMATDFQEQGGPIGSIDAVQPTAPTFNPQGGFGLEQTTNNTPDEFIDNAQSPLPENLDEQRAVISEADVDALIAKRIELDKAKAAGTLSDADHKALILRELNTLGIPVDEATFDVFSNSDQYGLVSRRLDVFDSTAEGGSVPTPYIPDPVTVADVGGVSGGSTALPTTPDATGSVADVAAEADAAAAGNADLTAAEHQWVYRGDGAFENSATGDVTIADTVGIDFVVGDVYSAGDGRVLDSAGDQVASVGQNDAGVNIFIPNVQGDSNVTGDTGTAGDSTGSGDGGSVTPTPAGTAPTPTTTPTAGDGGGTGDGSGDGDGAGTTNNVIAVSQPSTPITDGMFADFAPRFKQQVSRNLLNPNFRS